MFQCPRERFLDLEPFSPFLGSSTCSKSKIDSYDFDSVITIVDNDNDTEDEEDLAQNVVEVEDDDVQIITTDETTEEVDSLIDAEKTKHSTAAFQVLSMSILMSNE